MTADLFRYREVVAGIGRGPLASGLERGELSRVCRGVYTADRLVTPDDGLRALFLRLPRGSVLGFHSAAERYGFGVLPSEQVHVVIPAGVAKPRIRGVVAHEAALGTAEPTLVAGVPCVTAARCAVDLARTVRRIDALPVLDAALRSGACHTDELAAEAFRHRGLPGVRQARELVPLADGRSECRQESQLRLVIVDGGLPRPVPQVWVDDEFGTPRYRLDLAYPGRRLGLEYDGVSHTDRNALRRDRARLNWLAARGWTMRFFTDADLYRRPFDIVVAVRTALNA